MRLVVSATRFHDVVEAPGRNLAQDPVDTLESFELDRGHVVADQRTEWRHTPAVPRLGGGAAGLEVAAGRQYPRLGVVVIIFGAALTPAASQGPTSLKLFPLTSPRLVSSLKV